MNRHRLAEQRWVPKAISEREKVVLTVALALQVSNLSTDSDKMQPAPSLVAAFAKAIGLSAAITLPGQTGFVCLASLHWPAAKTLALLAALIAHLLTPDKI